MSYRAAGLLICGVIAFWLTYGLLLARFAAQRKLSNPLVISVRIYTPHVLSQKECDALLARIAKTFPKEATQASAEVVGE